MTEEETQGFQTLLAEAKRLTLEVDQLQSQLSGVRVLIVDEMVKARVEKVESEGVTASWTQPSVTKRLDRALLIQAGVTPDQLDKGTVETSKKGFLTIRIRPA